MVIKSTSAVDVRIQAVFASLSCWAEAAEPASSNVSAKNVRKLVIEYPSIVGIAVGFDSVVTNLCCSFSSATFLGRIKDNCGA